MGAPYSRRTVRQRPSRLAWRVTLQASLDEEDRAFDGTGRFQAAVYVLHAFQKKAKRGIAMPKQELDLAWSHLQAVELHY